MPNGHTVYTPAEFILTQPYSGHVEVWLLNNEQALEESSVVALADQLEGHPEFFLCKLGVVNGTIVTVEEIYLP